MAKATKEMQEKLEMRSKKATMGQNIKGLFTALGKQFHFKLVFDGTPWECFQQGNDINPTYLL